MQNTSFYKLILFLISFVFAASAGASNSCKYVMKSGKYKGQEVDTSEKRPIRILRMNEDTVLISNFRVNGEFLQAKIPLNQVEQVSYLAVDLNTKPLNTLSLFNVAHTQLRFKFKTDAEIELFTESGQKVPGDKTLFDNDLIVSLNYMAPKGVPYNPIKGLNENLYASTLQVFSTKDEVKTRFEKQKFNVYEVFLVYL